MGIDSLPDELLVPIFLSTRREFPPSPPGSCTDVLRCSNCFSRDNMIVPATISGVSRRWRKLAISTRNLWTHIFISLGATYRHDGMSMKTILTWLERSREAPLTVACSLKEPEQAYGEDAEDVDRVDVGMDFWADDLPVLSVIFAASDRVESIYLSLGFYGFHPRRFPSSSLPIFSHLPSTSQLQRACVYILDIDNPDNTDTTHMRHFVDSLFVSLSQILAASPVQEISIKFNQQGETLIRFTIPTQIHPLRSLSIPEPHFPSFRSFLDFTPNLTTLKVKFSDWMDPQGDRLSDPPRVILPQLRTMELLSYGGAIRTADFVNSITAPALTSLTVAFWHQPKYFLQDSFRQFLTRSACYLEELAVRLGGYPPEDGPIPSDPLHRYSFPLHGALACWDSMKKVELIGFDSNAALLLCSACKQLDTIKLTSCCPYDPAALEESSPAHPRNINFFSPARQGPSVLSIDFTTGEDFATSLDDFLLPQLITSSIEHLELHGFDAKDVSCAVALTTDRHSQLSSLSISPDPGTPYSKIKELLESPAVATSLHSLSLKCQTEYESRWEEDWSSNFAAFLLPRPGSSYINDKGDEGCVPLKDLKRFSYSGAAGGFQSGLLAEVLRYRFEQEGLQHARLDLFDYDPDLPRGDPLSEEDWKGIRALQSAGHQLQIVLPRERYRHVCI